MQSPTVTTFDFVEEYGPDKPHRRIDQRPDQGSCLKKVIVLLLASALNHPFQLLESVIAASVVKAQVADSSYATQVLLLAALATTITGDPILFLTFGVTCLLSASAINHSISPLEPTDTVPAIDTKTVKQEAVDQKPIMQVEQKYAEQKLMEQETVEQEPFAQKAMEKKAEEQALKEQQEQEKELKKLEEEQLVKDLKEARVYPHLRWKYVKAHCEGTPLPIPTGHVEGITIPIPAKKETAAPVTNNKKDTPLKDNKAISKAPSPVRASPPYQQRRNDPNGFNNNGRNGHNNAGQNKPGQNGNNKAGRNRHVHTPQASKPAPVQASPSPPKIRPVLTAWANIFDTIRAEDRRIDTENIAKAEATKHLPRGAWITREGKEW